MTVVVLGLLLFSCCQQRKVKQESEGIEINR